jgi:hypothetical protein
MSGVITISGLHEALATTCTPPSYYRLQTKPQNVTVTNVQCSSTGHGLSVCPLVDVTDFANKTAAAIQKEQTRDTSTACQGCGSFKLADFDKTRPYTGQGAVFLDGLGRVVDEGPTAVSKVTFDWSFNLQFFGEFGLCLADAAAIKAMDETPTLN